MQQSTILVKGKPFVYEDESEDLNRETAFAIAEEDARTIMEKVNDLFGKCGIDYSLSFGTLLGAIRDGGLIKGDEDVDIYVLDIEKVIDNIPFLYDNGLKLCRVRPEVYSFRINDKCYVDVYFRTECKTFPWSLYCDRLYARVVPSKLISNFRKIDFLGVECNCPREAEKLLTVWYGKDWRIPKGGHGFRYEVASHYYAARVKNFILNLFR